MDITIVRHGNEPNHTGRIQEGDERHDATVESFEAIAPSVFSASQYFGGGTYTAVIRGDHDEDGFKDGEQVFRMTTEWLEGGE